MIKFILPNGFTNPDNNLGLIEENEYQNLFWGIETEIPFSIFTGRINNNNNFVGTFLSYDDIVKLSKCYNEILENMFVFDFGNLFLEEGDYENCLGDVIFTEFVNQKNVYFEIADINFIDFLVKKYPQIQIILHENYTIFYNDQQIQQLIDKYPNNIKAINITILHVCEEVNIPKIGILNLDSCYYCPQFPLCLNKENKSVLRFRKASMFNECQKKKLINIDTAVKNLSLLLKHTDMILFETIPLAQQEDYLNLINLVLKNEEIKEEEKKDEEF